MTKSTDQMPQQQIKPAQEASSKACLFKIGGVCATSAAIAVLEEAEVFFFDLVMRHAHGDFGVVGNEYAAMNREAIENGSRILSSYLIGDKTVVVITEANRSLTTVLLPSDY